MPIDVRVTWRNDNPNTIWNRLAARFGREPTNAEAKEEMLRLLRDLPRDQPEPCLTLRCRSPIACGGFGYCRERNRYGLPGEAERLRWQAEAKAVREGRR